MYVGVIAKSGDGGGAHGSGPHEALAITTLQSLHDSPRGEQGEEEGKARQPWGGIREIGRRRTSRFRYDPN